MQTSWRDPLYEIGWLGRPTPAVKWLLVLNFVFFCLQVIFEKTGYRGFQEVLQLNVATVGAGWAWQFFTYMFLHAGAWHLILNLLMLYLFGNQVEEEIGSKRFLQVYFLGGICGGLLWYAFFFTRGGMLVGSSGAIYAVTVAFATLFPNRPITVLLFFVLPVTLLAKYWAIAAVVLSSLFALNDTGNIGHLAHLGGMAVGYLFIKALSRKGKPLLVAVRTGPPPSQRAPRRPMETMASPFSQVDFMSQKIDPILDKIAEHGIQSLTREERRILEQAKDRLP